MLYLHPGPIVFESINWQVICGKYALKCIYFNAYFKCHCGVKHAFCFAFLSHFILCFAFHSLVIVLKLFALAKEIRFFFQLPFRDTVILYIETLGNEIHAFYGVFKVSGFI